MILQGLYKIIDLYLGEYNAFYSNIDKYFLDIIRHQMSSDIIDKDSLNISLKKIISLTIEEITKFGLKKVKIENKFVNLFSQFKRSQYKENISIEKILNDKI